MERPVTLVQSGDGVAQRSGGGSGSGDGVGSKPIAARRRLDLTPGGTGDECNFPRKARHRWEAGSRVLWLSTARLLLRGAEAGL